MPAPMTLSAWCDHAKAIDSRRPSAARHTAIARHLALLALEGPEMISTEAQRRPLVQAMFTLRGPRWRGEGLANRDLAAAIQNRLAHLDRARLGHDGGPA